MRSLTPAVVRALQAARGYALGQKQSDISPAHLLHGLLQEEEGQAAALAAAAGLTLDAYRATVGPSRDEGPASLPLADRTHDALALARDLALELTGESTVSSGPLLLALLQSDPQLCASLETFGFRIADLQSTLHLHKPPVPSLDEPLDLIDETEMVDTARILDAGANRVREALRIIEDYCRFVLEDSFLSGELKRLRHDFTSSILELAPKGMLHARDTLGDVGTTLSTETEQHRSDLTDVVQANLKRLQESLRSLEEFAKITGPLLAERLEQMRYRAYTLERAIILGREARQVLRDSQLYVLLSGADCARSLGWTITEAAGGGASIIQLREKGLSDQHLLQRAREVRRLTHKAGVLFIVNDRPDIARLVEADGVHLGQNDLPVKEARRLLGSRALIGVSTHTIEQVRAAVLDGASYLGIGPAFSSGTKVFDHLPGPAFIRAALAETTLPAFAIGGINLKTVGAAVESGARRVAVSQAIAQAEDPRGVAKALLSVLLG
jgi:thiamine-phosphate pyrophosphorylase